MEGSGSAGGRRRGAIETEEVNSSLNVTLQCCRVEIWAI